MSEIRTLYQRPCGSYAVIVWHDDGGHIALGVYENTVCAGEGNSETSVEHYASPSEARIERARVVARLDREGYTLTRVRLPMRESWRARRGA